MVIGICMIFFFSSRRRHTRSLCDWSSDVCSSDLKTMLLALTAALVSSRAFAYDQGDRDAHLGRLVERPGVVVEIGRRRVGKECRSGWSAYSSKKNSSKANCKMRPQTVPTIESMRS